MSALKVLVYDDEFDVAKRIAKDIQDASNGVASAQPKSRKDFDALLRLLDDRRTATNDTGSGSGEAQEVDEADVIVVDYDLRLYSGSATGSRLAYLLRCFSECGFIVIVNQYGTNTFDLGLSLGFSSGFNNMHFDFADLHVGDAQMGNPGLWQSEIAGYRPWYWPIIPDAKENFKKCVEDVREHYDESIIDFLGLNGVTDWIPERARSFLSGGYDIREVTFESFGQAHHSGIDRKDRDVLTPELFPRVIAARVITFLNSVLLPEQSVLVDAPHLISRFPSLIQGSRADMDSWNVLCNPSASNDDELLSDRLKKHKFKKPHWLWRAAWLWPDIFRDTNVAEVQNPWAVEQFDWVFCEDISRFIPEESAREFNALVSPPFLKRFLLDSDSLEASDYAPQIGNRVPQDPSQVDYAPQAALSL